MTRTNHLPFPSDLSSLTRQEVDDFRSFCHVMGDCYVLGAEQCLMEPMSSWRCLWGKLHSLSRHSRLAFSQLCLPSQANQVPQLSRSFKKLAVRLLVIHLWSFAYEIFPTTDDRDRSRAGGKSRGRSIHQHIVIAIVIRRQVFDLALCLSCSFRLSLGRSVAWADYTANVALFVLRYIGARFRSYVAVSPLANHPHNSHGGCPTSLFCPFIESPPSTSP